MRKFILNPSNAVKMTAGFAFSCAIIFYEAELTKRMFGVSEIWQLSPYEIACTMRQSIFGHPVNQNFDSASFNFEYVVSDCQPF